MRKSRAKLEEHYAEFGDFSDGVYYSNNPSKIPDNAVSDSNNMELTASGFFSKRNGTKKGNTTTVGSSTRFTSLKEHLTSAGVSTVIGTYTDTIGKLASGAWATLETGLTYSDYIWHWVDFVDSSGVSYSIGGDGKNDPKIWDGTTLANLAGTPPTGRIWAVWGQRVWCVDNTHKYRVYGSKLGDHEGWTGGSGGANDETYLDIVGDNVGGGEITGLIPFYDYLLVFKRDGIFRIYSTGAITDATKLAWTPVTLSVGASSPRAIIQVGNDIMFLDGVTFKTLSAVEEYGDIQSSAVSNSIQLFLENGLNTTLLNEAIMVNYTPKGQVFCFLPSSESLGDNDLVFVYDYRNRRSAWYPFGYTHDVSCAMTKKNGSSIDLYTGANDGFVYQLDIGTADAVTYVGTGGSAIDGYFITKSYDFNLPRTRKTFRAIDVIVGQAGSYTLDILYGKDFAVFMDMQLYSGDASLWDEALWDVATWDVVSSVTRKEFGIGNAFAYNLQLKIGNSNVDEPFVFYSGTLTGVY